jgi:spore maturation protein CgeB
LPDEDELKIVFFGLSITSAWGNGHATTYRALARALHKRGHDIIFFEHDLEWYASNRDMPEPEFCAVHIYDRWREILPLVRRELASSDVAVVGSFFPEGVEAIDEVLASSVTVKAFYDIDTPITVAKLKQGSTEYIDARQIPGLDLYFSFTGGPMLAELEDKFGARQAVPLYCSFDPEKHRLSSVHSEFICDLSYMGTYAPDRQMKLDELFCLPARQLPRQKFALAGAQYPLEIAWPKNVQRTIHLHPRDHAAFYCSSRMTLNLTRREMIATGYSPSVRLFEAAGCGATIVSDNWSGLDTFFKPEKEILLADFSSDMVRYLEEVDDHELSCIGKRAQERVLREHSAERRAIQFEEYISTYSRPLPVGSSHLSFQDMK